MLEQDLLQKRVDDVAKAIDQQIGTSVVEAYKRGYADALAWVLMEQRKDLETERAEKAASVGPEV